MNEQYYSHLDKIILRSKRKRMMREYLETGKAVGKFLALAVVLYGAFYFGWSMLCYVFPEW